MGEQTEPSEPSDPLADVDPALLRGLMLPRLSRRKFLQYAGAGAGAAGLSAFLSACGVSSVKKGGTNVDWATFWPKQKQAGTLNFANWPLYIDRVPASHASGSGLTGYPSLDYFAKKTGILVNYKPVINDNPSFFATIRPSLEQGQDTGWDLMVLSSGTPEANALTRNGWLTPLDQTAMTNFYKNAAKNNQFLNPWYDPGNKYTMPWQAGFTGIGVNTKYLPAGVSLSDITSLNSLWDPRFKGKVGMFADYEELGSAALLKMGIQPAESTPDQWRQAAAVLKQQRDDGIVRAYYEQGYINKLQNGDVVICQAWSGDVLTSQLSGYPELQYVTPTEGQMFWADCMMIPLNAKHPRDAMTYMDFVYDPYVAAMIVDWVWYMSPVPAAKNIITSLHNSGKTFFEGLWPTIRVAESPLCFPTQQEYATAKQYHKYTGPQDEQLWISIFEPIYQS